MIKIVCTEDEEFFAREIVDVYKKHGNCPPVDCDNPCADCEQCKADYIKIEVLKDSENE